MVGKSHTCHRLTYAVWIPLFVAVCGPAGFAADFTPASQEVRAAVERAVVYLEANGSSDHRLGARALAGLAIYKHRGQLDHPKVQEQLSAIRGSLKSRQPSDITAGSNWDIYSTGMALIFLCEADPAGCNDEITKLLRSLEIRQKPNGGWGYPDRDTGDTSMTQYGVLGTWIATQEGFHTSPASVEKVATWLMRTQDPSGGFGYQGIVPSGAGLVSQTDVRLSLTSAGLGSVYMCADLLGFIQPPEEKPDGLPEALRELPSKDGRGRFASQIDQRALRETAIRGNAWMAANYKVDQGQWQHYYMYALERYQSFRELAEGTQEPSPEWYNLGAEFLIKTQKQEGKWDCGQSMVVPDTAFGTLFLLRSTKRTIEKAKEYGTGILVGGRGLPQETGAVEVRDGQIVAKPLLGPGQALLAALENPSETNYAAAVDALRGLPSDDIHELVSRNAEKLRALAGERSPEARLAAVQALGRSRDLDNVPTLIYALSDPDRPVMQAAREALMRVSRRFDAMGIPENPSEIELRNGIQRWKEWYRRVRPDAEFDSP